MEVESHGANPVPAASRTQGWFTLFAMYAGVNVCLPMIMVGSVFIGGLSLRQTILVGILGNVIAASLMSLASYPGIDHGLPSPVLTRVFLGYPVGTNLASIVIVATMVGWFAVQAELAGTAADGILRQLTGVSIASPMIIFVGATNVFFAVVGFGWMRKLSIAAVPALLLLGIALLWKIISTHPLSTIHVADGKCAPSFLEALNIMVAGQIGASFTASDISRYAKDRTSVWLGILLGVAPVATFMIMLGALATATTGEQNPVKAVEALGFGLWALVLIVLATFTTNDKNLYSGGLAATNIFPGVPRWLHTLALGILGTVVAWLRITEHFTQWLLALGTVFAPLVGILLADYFIVRARQIDTASLYRESATNRFSSGINGVALVSIAVGILSTRVIPPRFIQPLMALAVSALIYTAGMLRFYPARVLPKEP